MNEAPPSPGAIDAPVEEPLPRAGASILEIRDERHPLSEEALQLIAAAFDSRDRQQLFELRSEIAEKRLALLASMDFHLLVAVDEGGRAVGTIAGIYLEGVNAGFITYLTVDPAFRRQRLAPRLRTALVEVFREDARRAEFHDLDWVLGEVRSNNPWLKRLVRTRGAITFDLTYYHPGMTPDTGGPEYVLYRQPVGDPRTHLPVDLVRRILYCIYGRGYRVRYPLQHPGFRSMLEQLKGRENIGPRPED